MITSCDNLADGQNQVASSLNELSKAINENIIICQTLKDDINKTSDYFCQQQLSNTLIEVKELMINEQERALQIMHNQLPLKHEALNVLFS